MTIQTRCPYTDHEGEDCEACRLIWQAGGTVTGLRELLAKQLREAKTTLDMLMVLDPQPDHDRPYQQSEGVSYLERPEAGPRVTGAAFALHAAHLLARQAAAPDERPIIFCTVQEMLAKAALSASLAQRSITPVKARQ